MSFTELVASVSAEMCGHKSESAECLSQRDISVDGGQIMDQIQSVCQHKNAEKQVFPQTSAPPHAWFF